MKIRLFTYGLHKHLKMYISVMCNILSQDPIIQEPSEAFHGCHHSQISILSHIYALEDCANLFTRGLVVHNNLSNIVRSHHLQSGTSGQHDSSASFSSGKDALVSNAGQLKVSYFTSACCLQHAQA